MSKFISYLFLAFLILVSVPQSHAQRPDISNGGSYQYGYFDSYGAAVTDLSLVASATDIFCINGSASKTIYISHVNLTGSATSATKVNVKILKRSTADSGGTSTTLTNVPSDSQIPAGTAVVKAYTANPTVGTLVGEYYSEHAIFPAEASPNNTATPIHLTFGCNGAKLMTLRGTNESLCININGETVTGGVAHVGVRWIEQ
jgi:hypothetical protein